MSRNSVLVAFGCIWTFCSVLYVTDMVVATPDLYSLAAPLGAGLLAAAAYWWACAVADASCLRATANMLHIAVPMIWIAWIVSLHQTALTADQGVLLVFTMAFGAAVADMGSFGDLQIAQRKAQFFGQTESYTHRPLSAYDSGRFTAPVLSACDSGSFPRP